jgi:ABC-type Fe3+-hydroxamate transport system substrate-binding protein
MKKLNLLLFVVPVFLFISYLLISIRFKKNTPPTLCPRKIASLLVGLDEIAFYLAKEKLVGVSYLSFDSNISNISNKISSITPLRVDSEQIIKLKPDILLLSKFSNTNFINLLSEHNIRTEFFDKFDSLKDITQNIKKITQLSCAKERGRKLLKWIKNLQARLNKECKKVKKRYSVLQISYNLLSPGKDTIISDIFSLACLKNKLAENNIKGFYQLKIEDILTYNPDFIIFDNWVDVKSFFERFSVLKKLEAYKNNRIVQIESKLLMATSHYAYLASWVLFKEIYKK